MRILLMLLMLIFSSTAFAGNNVVDDRYLNARMNVVLERLSSMDKALSLQERNTERAVEMQIKEEFAKKERQFALQQDVSDLRERISNSETRNNVWLVVILFFFTILQIGIAIWQKTRIDK